MVQCKCRKVANTLAYYDKELMTTVKSFAIKAIGFCKSFQVYFSTCDNKLECLSLPATSALAQYFQSKLEPTLRLRSLIVRCKCLKVANTLAYYDKILPGIFFHL